MRHVADLGLPVMAVGVGDRHPVDAERARGGFRRPRMTSIAVVLPAPVGPTKPALVPAGISRLKPVERGPLGAGIGVAYPVEPQRPLQPHRPLAVARPRGQPRLRRREIGVQRVERGLAEADLRDVAKQRLDRGHQLRPAKAKAPSTGSTSASPPSRVHRSSRMKTSMLPKASASST